MNFIRKFLRDCMTGKNGQTYDIGRVSWIVTTASIIVAYAWKLHLDPVHVNIKDLAMALSINAGAHGAAVGFKANTEPEEKES